MNINKTSIVLITLSLLSVCFLVYSLVFIYRTERGGSSGPIKTGGTDGSGSKISSDDEVIVDPNGEDPSFINDSVKMYPLEGETTSEFVDDSIIIVTKNEPRYSLIASVSGEKTNTGYVQASRVSFYNGVSWSREVGLPVNKKDTGIIPGGLVKSWTINHSLLVPQEAEGELEIKEHTISFKTGLLENELTLRSLPQYTKFISSSDGILVVNGISYDAKIAYARIYSSDVETVKVYNDGMNFQTDWLVFWDNNGGFYHLDKTEVFPSTSKYRSHSIAYYKEPDGSVIRTYDIQKDADSKVNPSFKLGGNINKKIIVEPVDNFQKYPELGHKWELGNCVGYVLGDDNKKIEGIGILEYINSSETY